MIKFSTENLIPQLSIDCVIFGYQERKLKVLIPKINLNTVMFTLPGGFIFQDESIDRAAKRILKERTQLDDIYLEQFKVFGELSRANKLISEDANLEKIQKKNLDWLSQRFVSIGYYALVDSNKVNPQTGDFDESINWYNVKDLPKMIMNHSEIVESALETLRQNLDQKLIGFNLLPDEFTMREVQELYEAIYDKPYARNNFQKKILDLNVLERLDKKFTGAANKAPYLYRFRAG